MASSKKNYFVFVTFGELSDKSNGGAVYTSGIARALRNKSDDFEIFSYYACSFSSSKWARKIFALWQMIFSRRPMPVGYFYSYRLIGMVMKHIESLLGSPEAEVKIFIDHLELMYLAARVRDRFGERISIVHVSHNLESGLFMERLGNGRLAHAVEAWASYQRYEHNMLSICDGIIAISEEEAGFYRMSLDGKVPARVIPPLFDYAPIPYPYKPGDGKLKLVFLANLDWWPNMDAVQWLLDELAPVLDEKFELHVYGKGSGALKPSTPRVFLHGFVLDIYEVWSGCFATLAPIINGSGVNIKVAESLYNGVPLICTPLALRGLPAQFIGGSIALEREASAWAQRLWGLACDSSEYLAIRSSCNYPHEKSLLSLLEFEK